MHIVYYYIFYSSLKQKILYIFFFPLSIANEFIKSLIPIIKKVIEAIDLRTTSGKKLEMEPPVKAPSKLAKTSAEEDPKKTANGLFEVPLIVRVASWVLSPNSAIKTVINVDSNKLKTILNNF